MMIEIDTQLKEQLTTAYMNLFDAMTAVYLANDLSQGESLYYATGAMRNLLSEMPQTPRSKFLVALFNTHKTTVAKKSMLAAGMAEKPIGIIVPEEAKKKLTLVFEKFLICANWPEPEPLTDFPFKMPNYEFPPLPKVVIQDMVHDMKPKRNYAPVKQPIIQPKNFVHNYNLRNARRRTK